MKQSDRQGWRPVGLLHVGEGGGGGGAQQGEQLLHRVGRRSWRGERRTGEKWATREGMEGEIEKRNA